MKKGLLALSMLTTAGVFAQNGCCESDCCSTDCCEPCCVPQPKKCIDCECYTPQYYDLQCAWDFFVDVEFLYWYAKETNAAYAATAVAQSANNSEDPLLAVAYVNDMKRVGTSWDPGVRVGIGWNMSCDGWDLYLNWTYFKNSKKSKATGNSEFNEFVQVGDQKVLNLWVSSVLSGDFLAPSSTLFDSVTAKWKTRFNQIDLELGRKYWLSPCFTLRPFIGLRGAWTTTNLSMVSKNGPAFPTPIPDLAVLQLGNVDKDAFRNQIWGVGPMAGLQPNFYICQNFIIYGDLGAALIWGEHKGRKKQTYLSFQIENDGTTTNLLDTNNTSNNNFFLMSTLLDTAIGLRWEDTWCCDRYRTTLDIGWEHHIWFDHSHRIKTREVSFTGGDIDTNPLETNFSLRVGEVVSNLGYGGLVIRVRFDF